MALKISIPSSHLNTFIKPETNSCISRSVKNKYAIKASSLKQKPKKGIEIMTPSTYDFEATVIELERLFRDVPSSPSRLVPQRSGPSSPFPSQGGFSRRPVRVAYQGVRGSYCQEAAIKAYSSITCDAFPCHQMEDAFQSLEDNSADRAIIPVENSIDGSIDRNFDLLIRHHEDVEIVGELILPVNHCLLALNDNTSSSAQLRRIVSHPQALSHCNSNLELMGLDVDEVPNAADAAKYVSENKISDTAIIGSKIAAKEFGLKVLQENFQDPNNNFNRFLQLKLRSSSSSSALMQNDGEETSTSSSWKTTVAFSLDNGVSDLFRALWLFESRNITVTRIEHRPNRSNPVKVVEKDTGNCRCCLDYVFILDVKGKVSDSGVQSALSGLQEISSSGFVGVLGSYMSDSVSC